MNKRSWHERNKNWKTGYRLARIEKGVKNHQWFFLAVSRSFWTQNSHSKLAQKAYFSFKNMKFQIRVLPPNFYLVGLWSKRTKFEHVMCSSSYFRSPFKPFAVLFIFSTCSYPLGGVVIKCSSMLFFCKVLGFPRI